MRYPQWTCGVTTLALALTVGVSTLPAQGQQRIVITDLPLLEQTRIRTEMAEASKEATRLHSEARRADMAGNFKKAARLYEDAGRLRTEGDRLGIEGFELAGRAYYFSDQPGNASKAWEEAGNRGLILGDVYGSALNYMRAAVAAQDKGQRTRAVELGWKAYHLTSSPQLTKVQRAELRGHLRVSEGG